MDVNLQLDVVMDNVFNVYFNAFVVWEIKDKVLLNAVIIHVVIIQRLVRHVHA
jgi:hypothetical protein